MATHQGEGWLQSQRPGDTLEIEGIEWEVVTARWTPDGIRVTLTLERLDVPDEEQQEVFEAVPVAPKDVKGSRKPKEGEHPVSRHFKARFKPDG